MNFIGEITHGSTRQRLNLGVGGEGDFVKPLQILSALKNHE